MKQLYLHVGAGKTGSSALQAWLANNAEGLRRQGFCYRVNNRAGLNNRVSSGNGKQLHELLHHDAPDDQVYRYYFGDLDFGDQGLGEPGALGRAVEKVIISSEVLRINWRNLELFKSFCDNYAIHVNILIFIRNPIDLLCSSYLQGVKGRLATLSVADYMRGFERHPHLHYARFFTANFDDVELIHYNAHRRDVAESFCAAIGADYARLEAMQPVRVNRSLSQDEVVVIQALSRWCKEHFAATGQIESVEARLNLRTKKLYQRAAPALASRYLVNKYQQRESEICITQALIDELEDRFREEVAQFNCTLGKRYAIELGLFDSGGRALVEHSAVAVDPAILRDVAAYLVTRKKAIGDACLAELARRAREVDVQASEILFAGLNEAS